MLTYTKKNFVEDHDGVALNYVEGYCLSSDSKPTAGIANGSVMIEMNTSKVFFFDQAGQAWREF